MASEEFREAARAQGDALGFHARAVFVPHPIQDRTDEEMRVLAHEAFEAVLGMIRRPGRGRPGEGRPGEGRPGEGRPGGG